MRIPRAGRLAFAIPLAVVLTAIGAQMAPALGVTAAPGVPGKAATWAAGDKDGFGTARSLASKVWYTVNDGVLTEVFSPRIDTPATRDTQLVVTDGATFPSSAKPRARSRSSNA